MSFDRYVLFKRSWKHWDRKQALMNNIKSLCWVLIVLRICFTCLSFIVKVNTHDVYEVVIDNLCIIFSYILQSSKVSFLFWLFLKSVTEVEAPLEATVIVHFLATLSSNFFPYAVYCSKTLEQFSIFSERNINSKMLSLEVSPYCSCRKESTYNPHHGHQSFSKRNISCIFRQKSHTIRGTLLERYAFWS